LAEKADASSRSARKHVCTIKEKTFATHQKFSPHHENGATPKPIKQARFSGSDVAPRTRFARAKTPEQSPLSTKRSEYTVNLEPGSFGLKLEPVLSLKNGKKEFGCRVMKLLSNGRGSTFPSQALKSGKINVGDVITAVNGKTVTSKSYKEIVSMLTSSGDRGVTFRIPRSPAPVMPTTPASTIHSSSENAATGNAKSQHEEVMKTSPARSNKSSIGEDSTTVFSPSFVNRMTRSTVKDTSVFYESKPLSNILSTVTKTVTPTISTIKPMHVASALSKQASQVFAGNSSKETEETNHIKMELLNELSKAKTLLGEQEANILMMKLMLDIHREKVVIQTEKNILEDELSVAQNAQVRLRPL
jgi:ribosomal protein L11